MQRDLHRNMTCPFANGSRVQRLNIKFKFCVLNRDRFGKIVANSPDDAPSHEASVAAYASDEMAGNKRPSPTSVVVFSATVGNVPAKRPPSTAPPSTK